MLFGHDPSPDDIDQNRIGDCYLDSTMGEIARQDPGALRSMVHDNGNGTYDVTLHRKDNDLHTLGGLFGNDYKDQHITVTPHHSLAA